ncbi:hypothetical protein [Ensifer adhaerens]|uniref:hypothetical protein n=1 Tax=Ensifer adhaerens TaxID=106592 RepID=UPI00128F6FDF|nr:hypothetical protein [Ensifer adhaerens]
MPKIVGFDLWHSLRKIAHAEQAALNPDKADHHQNGKQGNGEKSPWQKHRGTVQINRMDYPRRDPCPAFCKYRQEHSRLCECKEAINKSLKYKDGVMAVGFLAKDAPRSSAILIGGHRKPAHDCPIAGAITSNFSGTVSAAGRCFDITGAVETWRQSGPRLDRQRQGKAV